MAYRLKQVTYNKRKHKILVQNENGPCPLIAAANALLLRDAIKLPSNCVGAGVIKIDELINVLAEKVLNNSSQQSQSMNHQFAVQEVMQVFPSLQYGMDVNPKFTKGPSGVEYTKQLNAFDLLHVDLVHGWLVDPNDPEEAGLIGDQTYNQLINQVIKGNEAKSELEALHKKSDAVASILLMDPAQQMTPQEKRQKEHQLSATATNGSLIHNFLERSAHQLTQYGLQVLHERVKENDLCVFFRNNHFNTLTKHKGMLYLLVTDLGFATMPDVIWERLDVIDGDTEYVNAAFVRPALPQSVGMPQAAATGQQVLANNAQSNVDFQLALQLSRESSTGDVAKAPRKQAGAQANLPPSTTAANARPIPQPTPNNQLEADANADIQAAMQASMMEFQREQSQRAGQPFHAQPVTVAIGVPSMADELMARQLYENEDASRRLAMQLQQEEREQQRQQTRPTRNVQRSRQNAATTSRTKTQDGSNCCIS